MRATTKADSYFSIEVSNTGPSDSVVHTLTFHNLPGQSTDDESPPIVLQTGRVGRLAAGAIELTRGDSVVYATASFEPDPKESIDFTPLSVEHQERFSAAGSTSGSYNKRDGRPAEHEILVCRLIDRPIRPLLSDWRHETQILSWVLSYDGVRSCDPLAVLASAAALFISEIPLMKPVAAVQVGMKKMDPNATVDNAHDASPFILNPNNEQYEASPLKLTIAGTADAVLMIEGEADFLPEATFLEAVRFGHRAVQVLCQGIEQLGHTKGSTANKKTDTLQPIPENIQNRVHEIMVERVDAMYAATGSKKEKGKLMDELRKAVVLELEVEFPDQTVLVRSAFKELLGKRMHHFTKTTGIRNDGRKTTDIRRLDMETGHLPSVHGSALFTRGETQCIATATLGDAGMRQRIDKISGTEEKRFYLQYTFPPSCVGETGRVGTPGRREVGHGNLAERALSPTLPSEEEFPYAIRVESLITESHGSSSMASVCGGCLALMDAGVPIKKPVAGIAMGMLLNDKDSVSDENAIVLSDITGTEDALGTMDFKVAGDREGVTTFQLDIKCEGLSLQTMERALEQARAGRLHILDAMEKVLSKPRDELPKSVPRMRSFAIAPEGIGKVIGPGGKQIRAIIEDFELANMDVGEDGMIQVTGFDLEKLEKAEEFVKNLFNGSSANGKKERKEKPKYVGPEPVVGENYTGKITGIHPFGVFVEILPGAEDGSTPGFEALVHVSELARERVRNCEAFMKSMAAEELTVKYMGIENGKARLSRKAVLEEAYGIKNDEDRKRRETNSLGKAEASEDELDVIAKAIEGL